MRNFILKIVIIGLSIVSSVFAIVYDYWALGLYLISMSMMLCCLEIKGIVENDPKYIEFEKREKEASR